ncbi:DUF4183 domain-containing protein [Alteribacillus bidgolensis]|uniref:DUF4183 domain-containing protein n=1 Tax=Alteribacillus bidgolensis TaxID=930129 RepID=A0A1G8JIQ3_9BACI|nr:DUF4183 domain-containing protein [Alteribacillus bidgolensis]SDI31085.1 protein of unknown function [Alteribacillus bidgolensis]
MGHKKQNKIIKKTFIDFLPPSGCPDIYPGRRPAPKPTNVLKTDTSTYYAIAEEGQRIYTNENALNDHGEGVILDPNEASYYNLFINGVMQPHQIYELSSGFLYLKSEDLPLKGSPIILQFVIIKSF